MAPKSIAPLSFLVFFLTALSFQAPGQKSPGTASDIYHDLQHLGNSARVLYLAAHPDDENTKVISWLENHRQVRTAYLSLTRGDGGQNLIGPELGAKLGVLRTQELLQARRYDGGEQFFSRALDFGYSKTAEETLEFWDREKILGDVVWTIRQFRPDVIITRFPAEDYGGHGHHTASARLAQEAFELAADEDAYPDQLEWVEPWQPLRLVWNHSSWWEPNLDSIARDNPRYITAQVGTFNPLLGLSCNEIASYSRTQHKSQGFGVSVDRSYQLEYFRHEKGKQARTDLLDDLDTTWARYGWDQAQQKWLEILAKFEPQAPHLTALPLLELRAILREQKPRPELSRAIEQVEHLAVRCLGLHAELKAPQPFLQSDSLVDLSLRLVNRSPVNLEYLPTETIEKAKNNAGQPLLPYRPLVDTVKMKPTTQSSQPYWLRKPYETTFTVEDQHLIGQPQNTPVLQTAVEVQLGKYRLPVKITPQYVYSDRVNGEQREPLLVVPPVTARPQASNMIYVKDTPQELAVEFESYAGRELHWEASHPNWDIQPSEGKISFGPQAQTKRVTLRIQPRDGATEGQLRIKAQGEEDPLQDLSLIQYEHIPKRMVLEPAEVNLVKLDLEKRGQRVAYIPGAGDAVDEAIRRMDYQVDVLGEKDFREADLSQYQAVVAGIRAYNTQEWLPGMKDKLLQYMKQGGLYLVQYNTSSSDLLTEDIGPYDFQISRERVTEERAEAHFLLPQHPVLQEPNALAQKDFEGWVQERGLYFADEWDEAYAAPLGWHDQGEAMRKGGLLVADYGEGAFIYTGISFFRELPAGVPGAYRLLANLLSYRGDE